MLQNECQKVRSDVMDLAKDALTQAIFNLREVALGSSQGKSWKAKLAPEAPLTEILATAKAELLTRAISTKMRTVSAALNKDRPGQERPGLGICRCDSVEKIGFGTK